MDIWPQGPRVRASLVNISVLDRLADPKQGGSFTRTAICTPGPLLLAVGRMAVAKLWRGPLSTLGSPLIGSRVMYWRFLGSALNARTFGVDTRTTESSLTNLRNRRASLKVVRPDGLE